MRTWPYPIGTVFIIILLWHFAVIFFDIPEYLIPAPLTVGEYIFRKWNFLLSHSWVTTYETLAGFFLSILVGIPLAITLVWSKILDRSIMPILVVSQTFPKVAIAPLLIIWFGLGLLPKVLVSFIIAFFPVVISGVTGMRSVETEMLELIHSMRASSLQIFWKMRLPYALPHLFSGFKVAITFAIVGAVIGEWVGADKGLGYMLLWANANLDTVLLFSILASLTVIGVILYYSVVMVERLIIPWHVSIREEEAPQPTM